MIRISTSTVAAAAVLLAASVLSAPASAGAQERHVVEPGELDRAAAEHRSAEQAQRQEVLDALEKERVVEAAERMDVDLEEAKDAVRTLSGAGLEKAADRARDVNQALAGGNDTIVISTTTLIIALLVLIIILVA